MNSIDSSTSLQELAAIVSGALEKAGIKATLSGGGAVSVYTDNEYESCDLDFITSQRNEVIAGVLKPLGFRYGAGKREFEHPDSQFYVEFPSGPLAFGETLVVSENDTALLETPFGPIRIVTPTQSMMDRLAHYFAWNDRQAFDQSVMIARRHRIDWHALREWVECEGKHANVLDTIRERAAND